MKKILCPEFINLGSEIISDFYSCLKENVEEIELCINKLDSGENTELVNDLFRSIHSLKGNCRMVLLTPFVNVTHELEEIVSEMREGERHFHHLYGSVFIAIVTLVDDLIRQLIQHHQCSGEALKTLTKQVITLKDSKPSDNIDDLAVVEKVLSNLICLQENIDSPDTVEDAVDTKKEVKRFKTDALSDKKMEDTAFFRDMAAQLDGLSVYRQNRTKETLRLCHTINEGLEEKVCIEQLTAAVYIHDMGMAFIPDSILSKQDQLKKEEISIIRQHIRLSTNLLTSIRGWNEAAMMVEQHHERFDGEGYPNGLKTHEIYRGAMVLALADTYYSLTNKRSDRPYSKNLFSAVTIINAESGKQFDPNLVDIFNNAIRKLYITKT